MSYAWILILITNGEYNHSYNFQEFASKQACLDAKTYVDNVARETHATIPQTTCVTKGGI